MHKTTKYFVLYFLLLYSIISCVGQRNNKNTNKFKSGGKFIPGKTKLSNKNSYNPRAKRPTIGDVLRSQGRGNPQRRRPGASPGGGGGYAGVDHNDADAVNRRNYLNNLKNNNKANNNNHRSTGSGNQVQYPNVGKIVPPLRRTEGENPPFAPSWTHCVISIQVSIAWVVVKSPHYPNKFQGQVQCSWIATAMEGYRVRLSFKDLDLLVPNNNGCGSQFVEVIDMDLQKSQARFCGTDLPGDYVSNGNKLRLDLQADAIATPYRGFMAAFRADKEVPGRRETSYFGQGIPAGPYNPLTQSPPSNPTNPLPLRRRITRPTTTPGIPGQKIYGARNQPRYENPEKDPEEDALDSSTTHLYIIIAVILVILVAAAAAYVFKRYFFKTFMAWRKKRKNGGEEMEMQKTEGVYGITKQTGLPGNVPLPPPPNQPLTPLQRRQSVSFKDGNYSENGMFQDHSMEMYPHSLPPSYHSSFGNLNRSHSMDDISNGWVQRGNDEPIYEDDAMSINSIASSIRSSNRHPEHEVFKRQKLMERQNSLRMRRNSFGGELTPSMPQNTMYPLNGQYQANSLYSQQTPYGYDPMYGVYGSLPSYGSHGAQGAMYPGYPMTARPLFTSSTSNLAANDHNNFMMQQYNGRSSSMYDLTTIGVPDMTSQWPTNLNQRHSSMTSSTNNSTSTNPILKKTTPDPQNELAFTALRSAKSMNDLTAINTKLNECVSWTLPSQRGKSFADLS